MLELAGAIVAGFFGGLIGTISGGGGLITIPYLLFAGLPIDVAIATSRMSAFGIGAGSFSNYYTSKKIAWKLVPPLLILAILGGLSGAFLVTHLNNDLLEKIAGLAILLLIPTLFVGKDFGLKEFKTDKKRHFIGMILYFLGMVYGGFFGPGAGVILIYILAYFFGLTFIRSSATNLVNWMALTVVAFAVFLVHGLVDFRYGISMLVGVTVGGYVGSKLAIEKGEGFVKLVLTVVILATSAKLLLF